MAGLMVGGSNGNRTHRKDQRLALGAFLEAPCNLSSNIGTLAGSGRTAIRLRRSL